MIETYNEMSCKKCVYFGNKTGEKLNTGTKSLCLYSCKKHHGKKCTIESLCEDFERRCR